jgi:hypothetical protein
LRRHILPYKEDFERYLLPYTVAGVCNGTGGVNSNNYEVAVVILNLPTSFCTQHIEALLPFKVLKSKMGCSSMFVSDSTLISAGIIVLPYTYG